MAPDNGW
ncbi:hypothetical protein YPPY71_4363, partial [Yersinia pestis PY-71]